MRKDFGGVNLLAVAVAPRCCAQKFFDRLGIVTYIAFGSGARPTHRAVINRSLAITRAPVRSPSNLFACYFPRGVHPGQNPAERPTLQDLNMHRRAFAALFAVAFWLLSGLGLPTAAVGEIAIVAQASGEATPAEPARFL